MARGKRSPERTAEERERAREERARRRAEGAGEAVPEPVSPAPDSPQEQPGEVADADAVLSMGEPAHDALGATGGEPRAEMQADLEAPAATPAEDAAHEIAGHEDGEHQPVTAELETLASPEPGTEPPAEPERDTRAGAAARAPFPSAFAEPAASGVTEPAAEHDPDPVDAPEPAGEHRPELADSDPIGAPEPPVEHRPHDRPGDPDPDPVSAPGAEPAAHDAVPAREAGAGSGSADPEAAPGAEGSAPRRPEDPPSSWPEHTRLPPPVPPFAPAGAGTRSPRERAASRPWRGRALALFVLAVVAALVVLIVHSLSSSGTSTPTPAPPAVARVLIAEGATRLQIEQTAARAGLKGSYRAASKRSPLLDPASFGAPRGTPDLEGFLFPATYELTPGAPAAKLVQEQLVAFRENFGSADVARAHALHVTPYELLTIASMIEREAQVPGDRAKIAAVIYNRLHAGMPLGIDATIYYAIELRTGTPTYTRELTESELHMQSAYNTRIHTGLPPTPISNPGVASITAAAHPAHVSYLYYVLAPDGCGEHVFSTGLSAFEANATAYQAAVRKNGGKPPTCKKK